MNTAQTYRRFVAEQAAGSSPTYAALAYAVADDVVTLHLLEELSEPKRQPNLLFGAVRLLGGPVADTAGFLRWVRAHWEEVSREMVSRSTQTNEAARCATHLPVLARLPGPLALLEVGASAGFCLYPDRYRYDYGTVVVGDAGARVTLPCRLENDVPLPERPPEVVWRAGLDLNPLDLTSDDDLAWLQALVWPEHHERLDRLTGDPSRLPCLGPPWLT